MSGGFFRGTSADQDTRFSNKQAKLMKSQKFAPELENLVDITKVKMDVMRPWIANRVTELLGFEDEVLINFIYGLLDGKLVNGKEIQISLTGFMEKNTGKFMKELWTLLLSAEKNASGVPQQFLDAKAEETRKKKLETDRITHEIQKRKEKEAQDFEEERGRKMDGKVDDSSGRANYDASETGLRQHHARDSNTRLSADEKKANERNVSRGRIRGTPSRSNSGSFSNSRSRSDERHRSRSISRSPINRRSVSSERVHHSPMRRSSTPQRFSASRRRSSHYRQKSISPPRRRSPSPIGRRVRSPGGRRSRSPVGRRSRSPVGRRSRSPVGRRYRSPARRRSRTPARRRSRTPLRNRRSPVRYRSRSPVRYRSRSPVRRRSRSPVRRRSPFPVRRRSPSPVRRRSPSPFRRRSPSPFRRQHRGSLSSPRRRSPSPFQHRPASPSRRSSASPGSRSSSPRDLSSQSPDQASNLRDRRSPKRRSSPVEPPQNRIRTQDHHSPGHQSIPRDIIARDSDRNSSRRGVPFSTPSPYNSQSSSESPPPRLKSLGEHRRANSPYESPLSEPVIEDVKPSSLQKSKLPNTTPVSPHVEKAQVSSKVEDAKNRSSGEKSKHSSRFDELKLSAQKAPNNVKGSGREESETSYRTSRKAEEKNDQGSVDPDYVASDKHRAEVGEKRKHKRSKRQESDDYSSDSQLEGRKESKRKRKEEKRLRKEERRKRREERRRRKDKKRAEKIKQKSIGTVSPPSDLEENRDGYNSDGPHVARRDSHSSDNEDESEPKKLEIALRQKALESLRAKKSAGH